MNNLTITKRIAFSTALVSTAMMAYSRRAYAACPSTGPATYLCSGSNTSTQTVNAAAATITTQAGFGVTTTSTTALALTQTGSGAVSFTDANASTITSGSGLGIFSHRYSGTGNVSITTNGAVTGGTGISVYNPNASVTINLNGNASAVGTVGYGIRVDGASNALAITTSADSVVTGATDGIHGYTSGTATITVGGDLTGTGGVGINLYGGVGNTSLALTTNTGSDVRGSLFGVYARNDGVGTNTLTINGDVTTTGVGTSAVKAYNHGTSSTDVTVTTGADSVLTGASRGLHARNRGTGNITVTANGEIGSTTSHALEATNTSIGGGITVTTGAASYLHSANGRAIHVNNSGTGATSATINGDLVSSSSYGAYLRGGSTSGAMTVTVGADADITSDETGLRARNLSTTAGTTVTVNGDITSTDTDAVYASAVGGDVSVTQASTSTLVAASDSFGIIARNTGTGAATVTANGTISGGRIGAYANAVAPGTNATVTVGATANISATEYAVWSRTFGSGTNNVTVNGDLTASLFDAVYMRSASTATDSNFTLASGASLTGQRRGFQLFAFGTGDTTITLNGDITSTTDAGIYVQQSGTMDDLSITLGNGADVSGMRGIKLQNSGSGDNTITLNGTNSITGTSGTAIDFGVQSVTLAVNGTSTIHGDVLAIGASDALALNNATITMDSGDVMNSFESVALTGSNTLTGDLVLGTTTISSGTTGNLHVNGNITATTLTLGSNVTLGGNHTLTGNLVIGSGATAAPGNSVGVDNVTGDVTFANGSTFDVELDGSGADQIIATGNITIDSGASLNITSLSAFSGSVDILSAGGTLTGSFGTVNLAGQSLLLSYTGSTLNLSSFNTSTLSAQAQAGTGSSVLFADHIAAQTAEYALSEGKYLWAKTLYRHEDRDNHGLYLGSQSNQYGVALGGQKDVADHYKLGFSLADIVADTKVTQYAGGSDSHGVFASLYGTYTRAAAAGGHLFATLGAMGGYRQNDMERRVSNAAPNAFEADNEDVDLGAMLQLGSRMPVRSWQVTPVVSASYLHRYADGFTEQRGGTVGMTVDDYDFGLLKTAQTVRVNPAASYVDHASGVQLQPYLEVGLAQETSVGDRDIQGQFANGTRFTNRLDDSNQHFTTLRLGAELAFSERVSGFVSYQLSRSGDETRSDAQLGASMKF